LLPHLTVLIALILGLTPFSVPPENPVFSLVGTMACTAVFILLSRRATARGMRAVEDNEMIVAEAALKWTMAWPLVGWVVALSLFEWGMLVFAYVPRVAWLGRPLVVFIPAALMFGAAWAGLERLQVRIILRKGGVAPRATFWRGVRAGLRRNSIVLVPMAVFVGVFEGIWVGGKLGVDWLRLASAWMDAMPLLQVLVSFGIVLAALPFVPRIFARLLKAGPLPDGPLRTTLERAAERVKLRYGDILVWNTPSPNAMVVGFTGGTRRIFLTRGIIDQMPEEELLAVFFHEAGHAKRNHIGQFLLLFFCVSLIFHASAEPLAAIGVNPAFLLPLHLGVLWFVIMGWVSRRFEREADVYGGENASIFSPDAPAVPIPGLERTLPRGAALMIRALDRVRRLSGHSYSHRHGSIEDRMTFLAAHGSDPAVREAYLRGRRTFNLGVAALVLVAVGATALLYPTEVAVARSKIQGDEAIASYETALGLRRKNDATHTEHWQSALSGFLASARRLEGTTGVSARNFEILNWYNAADTAWHGLWDGAQARTYFERTLKLIDAAAPSDFEHFQLTCRLELGRIAAMDRRFEDARRYLELTRHLSQYPRLAAELEGNEVARSYLRERVRLLDATIEGRSGEADLARPELKQLTTSTNESERWKELREDAQRELDWLEQSSGN